MPINIYSVANDLESVGWRLISTEYKNLDTELEMECPKGHKQRQTYKNWRKNHICQECMSGDPKKIKKGEVARKKVGVERILALDAATNITGYSVFDDGELISYGIYIADGTKDATERINEIKHWFMRILKEWEIDKVGIEHIQLQSYGKSRTQYQVELYRVLNCLQGVLVDTCFEYQIPCELAHVSSWRSYCGIEGEGRENKKLAAQAKVRQWYQQECTQDEADAICIGKYICHYYKTKQSSWGEML